MNKTLCASAIIAALCASFASADDTSGVTVSGYIRAGVLAYNSNANASWGFNANPAEVSTFNVIGRGNINFNGTENLGDGLWAVWQVNNRFSPTGNGFSEMGGQSSTWANDDTFVGLKGGFGQVRLGKGTGNFQDGKFEYSVWAGPENRVGWFYGGTGNNMVRYDMPTMGGLNASLQWSTDENKTKDASANMHTSLSVDYTADNWGGQIGYATNNDQTNANARNPAETGRLGQFHITGNFKPIDPLELAFEYQHNSLADGSKTDATALYGYYTIGKLQLGLEGGIRRDNSPNFKLGNEKYVSFLMHYAFSKRTMGYLEVLSDKYENGPGTRSGILVGLNKSF